MQNSFSVETSWYDKLLLHLTLQILKLGKATSRKAWSSDVHQCYFLATKTDDGYCEINFSRSFYKHEEGNFKAILVFEADASLYKAHHCHVHLIPDRYKVYRFHGLYSIYQMKKMFLETIWKYSKTSSCLKAIGKTKLFGKFLVAAHPDYGFNLS